MSDEQCKLNINSQYNRDEKFMIMGTGKNVCDVEELCSRHNSRTYDVKKDGKPQYEEIGKFVCQLIGDEDIDGLPIDLDADFILKRLMEIRTKALDLEKVKWIKMNNEPFRRSMEFPRKGIYMPDHYLPDTGFVRLAVILRIIPVGKTTWWAGVKSGRFPQPVKLGVGVTAWRVEDIYLLIEQINESRKELEKK